jgi:molybdopterin-guanine dinucleotide biosynthesis protein A
LSEGSAAPAPGAAPQPPLGVVLCGGASRRMGRDKATMGDPPWAHRVADTLQRAGCDPVVLLGEPPVACTDLDRLRAGGWELVEDRRAGAGPATALADYLADTGADPASGQHRGLVFAACDLPDLDPADVQQLMAVVAGSGGSAAHNLRGRAQLSLVALDHAEVARIAGYRVPAGLSLAELIGQPLLVEPIDSTTVEDVDQPR